MASDRDQWADNLSGENSGSWLAGFLADEDELDRRALWRLGSWGVGTVAAVVVALFAYQSSVGWRRDQVASTDLVRQSQQIQWIAKEGQNETRRLASAVETLNGDRDRLYARVTVLEQGLDSVTGSVARQGAVAAPAPSPATNAAAPSTASTTAPASDPPTAELIGPPAPATAASPAASQTAAAQAPSPNTSPASATPAAKTVATAAAAGADRTSPVTALPPDPSAPSASAPSQPTQNTARAEATNSALAAAITAPATAAPAPATAAQTPLMPAKSILAPPDPAAAKLIEPDPSTATLPPLPPPQIIAAAPGMAEPDPVETQAPAIAVRRTEFGIDLGNASSIDGLRALWRGLLKNRSNKALAELQPIIVVKERNNGLGMQLRLVAGPISDAAAAAKLCATLIDSSRTCETTVFDGQRLALKNDAGGKADSGAAAASSGRPAAMSTRSLRRRGGAAVTGATGAKFEEQLEQSPPQPAVPAAKSSALSSFLGMR